MLDAAIESVEASDVRPVIHSDRGAHYRWPGWLSRIADAKLVCNRCPVTTECLTWALDSGQDAGVWGGMSEDERRALKRRNARTRARSGV